MLKSLPQSLKQNFQHNWKIIVSTLLFLPLFIGGCTLPSIPFLPQKPTDQNGQPSAQKTVLTYWGLFESKDVMQPLIKEFEEKHPDVSIDYSARSFSDLFSYKETLLTRLTQGSGPDIFRFHVSWLGQFKKELASAPESVISQTDFENNFFNINKETLIKDDKIYAIPLEYDGLELFYNTEIFNEATISAAPKTWEEFRQIAVKLTKRDQNDRITQAGAAVGTSLNTAHATDILSLMMVQSAVNIPDDLISEEAQAALDFYVNLVKEDKVWDETLPFSIIAFANKQVAMMFAPSWRVFDLQNLNPDLKFSIARVPQLPQIGEEEGVSLATYWVEGVSADSKHQKEAWEFLKFLGEKEQMQKFFSEASKNRFFGEPYSRKDLASALETDKYLGPFMDDAKIAKSTVLTEFSGNDYYTEAIKNAISSVLHNEVSKTALETAKKTIERLLQESGASE